MCKKILVLLLVLGFTGTASAWMLTNGGFNDPTGGFQFEPVMPGWTMTDDATNAWYTEIPSPTHASGNTEGTHLLCTWVSSGPTYMDGEQAVASRMRAGNTYTFSMDVCNWTGGTTTGYLKIGTYDGTTYTPHVSLTLDDTEVPEGSGTGTTPNQDWHTKTVTLVADSYSGYIGDQLAVSFGVDSFAGGNYEFDGGVLTPEPATIALLGLGGLALIRRKRS